MGHSWCSVCFKQPHAVHIFVEADAIAGCAKIRKSCRAGRRCLDGAIEQRTYQRPCSGADVGPVVPIDGNAGHGRSCVVTGGCDEMGFMESRQAAKRTFDDSDLRTGRDIVRARLPGSVRRGRISCGFQLRVAISIRPVWVALVNSATIRPPSRARTYSGRFTQRAVAETPAD